jgi:CRP-like cAMP-binding protein
LIVKPIVKRFLFKNHSNTDGVKKICKQKSLNAVLHYKYISKMYEQLQKYITDRIKTDEEMLNLIFSKFKPLNVKRNTFLLKEGDVCKHYYFVNKGCIRLFNINKEGQEGTRYFAFEGSFGTALPSLIDQKPAFEYLQAVENSELLVDNTREFSFLYRQILEFAFITAQKRIYGFQGLEALEKVQWLLTYQPFILSRISNKLVASYLGLTPATLSRLKAQL